MIVHNVSLKWKEGVGPDDVAAVDAALDRLAGLPGVESMLRGANLGLNPATAATCDYAFSVRLADREAFQAYLGHPDHAALGVMLAPLVEGRMSAQLSA